MELPFAVSENVPPPVVNPISRITHNSSPINQRPKQSPPPPTHNQAMYHESSLNPMMYHNVRQTHFVASSSISSLNGMDYLSRSGVSTNTNMNTNVKTARNTMSEGNVRPNGSLEDSRIPYDHYHTKQEENDEDEYEYETVDDSDSYVTVLSSSAPQRNVAIPSSSSVLSTSSSPFHQPKERWTHPHTNPHTPPMWTQEGQDILTMLLEENHSPHSTHSHSNRVVSLCQQATQAVNASYEASCQGDISSCVTYHIQAALYFRQAALQLKLYPWNHGPREGQEDDESNSQSSRPLNRQQEQEEEKEKDPFHSQGIQSCISSPLRRSKDTATNKTMYNTSFVYSLLLLSYSHAKTADSLFQSKTVVLDPDTKLKLMQLYSHHRYEDGRNPPPPPDAPIEDATVTTTTTTTITTNTTQERLRSTIRASMGNKTEMDMTDSTFLGMTSTTLHHDPSRNNRNHESILSANHPSTPFLWTTPCSPSSASSSFSSNTTTNQPRENSSNPVDDMMKLERELRDMDMTLELGVGLGNSMTSFHPSHSHSIMKETMNDASFCVIPPSLGASYMASSSMWSTSGVLAKNTHHGIIPTSSPISQSQTPTFSKSMTMVGGRARANRVQTILDATILAGTPAHHLQQQQQQQPLIMNSTSTANPIVLPSQKHFHSNSSLDASWWGHASAMASSTVSLNNSILGMRSPSTHASSSSLAQTGPSSTHGSQTQSSTTSESMSSSHINTKQLMRLLDTIKTLGDENASLLHEVDNAKKARLEANAAREAMKQFKEEYVKRFTTLKAALDKFRREYQVGEDNRKKAETTAVGVALHSAEVENNPVLTSNFVLAASQAELQKRDEMIQKLTSELKQEKEESKKKESALRKYENFYKEVKARSAQKAKQREEEHQKQGGAALRGG